MKPGSVMAWRGIVVAEGLEDPRLVNRLHVYRAEISKPGKAIDYEGGMGRWHIYWVRASDSEIDRIQRGMLHAWYAHFWRDDDLLVVFSDERFHMSRSDPSTWDAARDHGQSQGIPPDELDFVSQGPIP